MYSREDIGDIIPTSSSREGMENYASLELQIDMVLVYSNIDSCVRLYPSYSAAKICVWELCLIKRKIIAPQSKY